MLLADEPGAAMRDRGFTTSDGSRELWTLMLTSGPLFRTSQGLDRTFG